MKTVDVRQYVFFKKLQMMPTIEKIILYGSRARGNHRERSDIDMAIVCPRATAKEWNKIIGIIENADTLLRIDCVRFDTLSDSNPLKQSIEHDGIIVYEKGSHAEKTS